MAFSGGRDRPDRSAGPADRAAEPPDGPDADPYEVARAICLRLLTDRARTRAELATALARRNVPPDVGDAVLDRFTELGFVDDGAFAAAWVQSRHAGRGLGRRALTHELRARGVDDASIATAVEAVGEAEEAVRARELVNRKLRATRGLPAATRARRLAGMLARKGYPGGLAARVVREALQADAADPGLLQADDAATDWAALGE
ncbi:MAG TPA: regulatory protein RecX [Mycobacteriales bacterium]|nr:regulatory protein RecX [Mycobacteriales bacterium]